MEKYQDFMFQIDYKDTPKLIKSLPVTAKLFIKKTEYEWNPYTPTLKTVYLHLQYPKTVEKLTILLPFAIDIKTDVPKYKKIKRTLEKLYTCDTILVKMAHSIQMQIGTKTL